MADSIQRQLGEITATLRAFREDLGELKTGFGNLAREQKSSAVDRSRQQQIIVNRIEAIERTTAGQHATNTQKLELLTSEIAAVKEPVSQFVSMRRRLSATLVAVSTGVGLMWTLSEPIYQFFVSKLFGH